MKLYRKFFSKKHDENWYRGEETENQKKNRKRMNKALVVSGAVNGALFGSAAGEVAVYNKALEKVLNAKMKDLDQGLAVEGTVRKTARRVKPQDKAAYNELLGKVIDRLKHNKNATDKFGLKAEKIVKKSSRIGALKGAAIGTAIGGGLAYMSNKSIKKANEKSNAARRNKSRKDSE